MGSEYQSRSKISNFEHATKFYIKHRHSKSGEFITHAI